MPVGDDAAAGPILIRRRDSASAAHGASWSVGAERFLVEMSPVQNSCACVSQTRPEMVGMFVVASFPQ